MLAPLSLPSLATTLLLVFSCCCWQSSVLALPTGGNPASTTGLASSTGGTPSTTTTASRDSGATSGSSITNSVDFDDCTCTDSGAAALASGSITASGMPTTTSLTNPTAQQATQTVVKKLNDVLKNGKPFVRFLLAGTEGQGDNQKVIESDGCDNEATNWNGILRWNRIKPPGDVGRKTCQSFILNPMLGDENKYWIQVSDSRVYKNWQAPGSKFADPSTATPIIGEANPLWTLDQQFLIECSETPDEVLFIAKDCKIKYFGRPADKLCLTASATRSDSKFGGLASMPCDGSEEVMADRFHLLRAAPDFEA